MKLYIKQRVFSWRDRFAVKDAQGADLYFVEGELFSLGKKLHIMDASGKEAAQLQQQLFTLMPRFEVKVREHTIAQIVRKFTLFFQRYEVVGPDWTVEGSFWDHDYTVEKDGSPVASIYKEWMSWGDSYVLDITDDENALLVLAVVLAIDAANESSSNN